MQWIWWVAFVVFVSAGAGDLVLFSATNSFRTIKSQQGPAGSCVTLLTCQTKFWVLTIAYSKLLIQLVKMDGLKSHRIRWHWGEGSDLWKNLEASAGKWEQGNCPTWSKEYGTVRHRKSRESELKRRKMDRHESRFVLLFSSSSSSIGGLKSRDLSRKRQRKEFSRHLKWI